MELDENPPQGGLGIEKRITAVVIDVTSAITLALGVAILLLPIVLGADNDSYIVIAEGARRDPIILLQFGLEWMFRADFLLGPASLIVTGLGLRGVVWRLPPSKLLSQLLREIE